MSLVVRARCIKEEFRRRRRYLRWLMRGKPIPPPHEVKQMTVMNYADKYGLHVLIETGTFLGDMVYAVRNRFRQIYSIELSDELCKSARERFADYNHIAVLQGDSTKVLPEVLERVKDPCLFWLDGHYSGGSTARGEKETPILEELHHIFGHSAGGHVILIDDARCFNGENSYPSVDALKEFILARCNDYAFEVKDDVIRAHGKV